MASVYIDVLFAINFIINILLIEASGIITATYSPWYRVLLASLLGAIYAVCVFFPDLGFLYTSVMKIAFSALIVFCAFKVKRLKHFFALLGAFYAVSFVFGGCVVALMSLTNLGRRTGAVYSNGIIYFDLPWQVLFVSTVASYALIAAIGRIRKKKIASESVKEDIEIHINGAVVAMPAIIDTGNTLFDPISGYPVIVCEYDRIKNVFPVGEAGLGMVERLAEHGIRARLVPYSSVGSQNGVMTAFRPDMVKIGGREAKKCVIGICETPLAPNGEYGALLNPQIHLL